MDWSGTPLGPLETWPQSLRTTVSLCLASNFPIDIIWGPRRVQIYNDGYRPICGGKHPRSMGQDFRECWESAWPAIGDAFAQALAGRADFLENRRVFVDRHGYLEETFFSFSFSPIRDETGGIGGLFHPVTETTAKMLSERRTRALRDLAARTSKAQSVEEALVLAAQTLGEYDLDLPFVLFYALGAGSRQARLAAVTGLRPGALAAPSTLDLGAAHESVWPLEAAFRAGSAVRVDDAGRRIGPPPYGPYPEPPSTALVLPLMPPGVEHPAGILVAGVSPRLPLDEAYQSFYDLLASAVTTAVTSARAYEEEKKRAEALAELDLAKTTFFSNVSHEFRTPLTLILGPVEDLLGQSYAEVGPAAKGQLEVIRRNSLRLLRLVNTMLDFSRIEAGRIRASYEPVDLGAYTLELAGVFRAAIERAGLRYVVNCAPLPGSVYVDHDMWEKMVLNLLSNAFKFTLEGEIEVRLTAASGHAELIVRDTGVGIPAEEIAHIFERFHRVQGSRGRTHEGTGIGLALVHEIVKLHGGTVTAESVLNRGTRFVVSVPFGKEHLDPSRIGAPSGLTSTSIGADAFVQEALRWLPPRSDAPGVGPRASGDDRSAAGSELPAALEPPRPAEARPRVLWADDNADMRQYVARLLASQFVVEAVADGQAALDAARASPPDLVLSDVMMPRLDGVGLLRALRADPRLREIPVILLSARAGEEARVEGMAEGADDYLVKPFSARELLARVEAHARMARSRREASEAVRRSEERLRRMVNVTGVGVLQFDQASGVLLDANEAFLSTFGYSREDVAAGAVTWRTMTPPEYVRVSEEQLERLTATGRIGPYEKEYLRKDGSRVWMLFAGAALGDGTLIEYCIDITDRKCAEAALRKSEAEREALLESERAARSEAERQTRLKDEFVAIASHELRTPINAILGFSAMLRSGKLDAGRAARAVDVIERNARALAQLVEDLLDTSRIVTGKLRLVEELVDLAEIVEGVIVSTAVTAEAKGVRVEHTLDRTIGPTRGDSGRLAQVVSNLLSNGVKFTPPGGRVEVLLQRADTRAQIIVRDTGKGISADFLPFVFDRFRQGDSSSCRGHGGLGLGLALVKQIVELHGGEVSAESAGEGRGATFTVTVPIAAIGREDREAPTALDACKALRGTKVLVVDDEEDAREIVRRMLEDCEVEVVTAGSAGEALDVLPRVRPDVLLSDIGMPKLDGYELLRAVRALGRERGGLTPAVALTAFSRPEDRARAIDAGYRAHVSKPVDQRALVRAVASAAGRVAAPLDTARK